MTSKIEQKIENKTTAVSIKNSSIKDLIESLKPQLSQALPKHISADRVVRVCLTALRTNPALAECDKVSLLNAIMLSSQLGLEINTPTGEAFIIPYAGKAQFQIGYKGIISLCHRTGEYKNITAKEVYKNDKFSYSYGLEPKLEHIPADVPQGEPIYYYALYVLKNGGSDFVVWSKEKIDLHRKNFSKYDKVWKSNYNSMAKKTVLIDVLKFAPKSIELEKHLSQDGAIRNERIENSEEILDIPIDFIDINEENVDKETGEIKR